MLKPFWIRVFVRVMANCFRQPSYCSLERNHGRSAASLTSFVGVFPATKTQRVLDKFMILFTRSSSDKKTSSTSAFTSGRFLSPFARQTLMRKSFKEFWEL